MATRLGTATGTILGTHFPHAVYARQSWADAWQSVTGLYANSVSWGSGSTIGEASLEREYGVGMPAGETVEAAYVPLDLLNWYVKVEIEQGTYDDDSDPDTPEVARDPLTWYGVIVEDDQDRRGALSTDAGLVLSGNQMLRAVGMEYLLTKSIVNTSHCRRYQVSTTTEIELRRALTFNEHIDNKDASENRTPTLGSQGVYLFTDDLAASGSNDSWSTKNIVEYLLRYYEPKDGSGSARLAFTLTAAARQALPDWDAPEVEADGRSVFELLNELCDRRRNLSWKASVNTGEEIEIDVFTFNENIITLPSGKSHAANPNPVVLDFDQSVDVRATLTDSASHVVDQVVVRGGYKRSCFSLSATDDGTLEADWDSADQTSYDAGPSGIGSLKAEEHGKRLVVYRSADQFERVYACFRLPPDWDGQVGNGIGGAKYDAFPDDPDYGQEHVYLPRWRFERHLPIGLVENAPDDGRENPIPPIALVLVESGTPDRYQHAEKLALIRMGDLDDGPGEKWSASLRIQKDTPGIIIKVRGAPQYIMASGEFSGTWTDITAEADWKTDLIITVMARLDSRVEVAYPAVASSAPDVVRRVFIDVGDAARLDYVVQGTVKGIDDGELQHITAGEYDGTNYIRDDRDAMRDLARVAAEWYGTPRQAFTFEIRQLTAVLEVGDLVTSVGTGDTQEDVNSVVTRHTINLRNGRTTYVTAFAELDFADVLAV